MKLVFASLLILSFLSIAVFGFMAMHRFTEHGHHGCIAVIANGLICLKDNSPLASAIFHLNTLKSFSTAVFTNNLNMMLLALLALVLVAAAEIIRRFLKLPDPHILLSRARKIFSELTVLGTPQKFLYWLSLHENSPALSSF